MKATAIQSINGTQPLIKASILLVVTILFLTGGTAYASHRHHDYNSGQSNSGLSITLGYIYYPKVHLYQDAHRQPHHYRHYNKHHYRGNHGHHKPWKNKHARKHRHGHHDY